MSREDFQQIARHLDRIHFHFSPISCFYLFLLFVLFVSFICFFCFIYLFLLFVSDGIPTEIANFLSSPYSKPSSLKPQLCKETPGFRISDFPAFIVVLPVPAPCLMESISYIATHEWRCSCLFTLTISKMCDFHFLWMHSLSPSPFPIPTS